MVKTIITLKKKKDSFFRKYAGSPRVFRAIKHIRSQTWLAKSGLGFGLCFVNLRKSPASFPLRFRPLLRRAIGRDEHDDIYAGKHGGQVAAEVCIHVNSICRYSLNYTISCFVIHCHGLE